MADREHISAAKKAVYLDRQMFATIMWCVRKGSPFAARGLYEILP